MTAAALVVALALALCAASSEERIVARARGLLAAREVREAETVLETEIARDEDNASHALYFWLSECRRDLLDLSGALAAMSEAHRRAPEDAGVALALGNLHFVRREMDRAAALYRDVLRIEPENVPAARNLEAIARDREAVERLDRRLGLLLAAIFLEALALTGALALVCRAGREDRPEDDGRAPMPSGRSIAPRL